MALLLLLGALVVLMIDSAIELALISSMVGYLHRSGANRYPFLTSLGEMSFINAKPAGLLLNEGHTSNGAAGTSLILICFGGFLVLWFERRRERAGNSKKPSGLFITWTIFAVLSTMLSLAALIYTSILSTRTSNQSISLPAAVSSSGHAYPLNQWTPQTWTSALIDIVMDGSDRQYLGGWLKVMQGWRWNLIPLFVCNTVVAGLAVRECMMGRRGMGMWKGGYKAAEMGEGRGWSGR